MLEAIISHQICTLCSFACARPSKHKKNRDVVGRKGGLAALCGGELFDCRHCGDNFFFSVGSVLLPITAACRLTGSGSRFYNLDEEKTAANKDKYKWPHAKLIRLAVRLGGWRGGVLVGNGCQWLFGWLIEKFWGCRQGTAVDSVADKESNVAARE